MAQSKGDSVGSIVGFGHLLQSQQPLGHIHHLMLGGIAVTDHRLFYLSGFIGGDLQSCLTDGQQDDTSCLGNTDAGGDVLTEK